MTGRSSGITAESITRAWDERALSLQCIGLETGHHAHHQTCWLRKGFFHGFLQ